MPTGQSPSSQIGLALRDTRAVAGDGPRSTSLGMRLIGFLVWAVLAAGAASLLFHEDYVKWLVWALITGLITFFVLFPLLRRMEWRR